MNLARIYKLIDFYFINYHRTVPKVILRAVSSPMISYFVIYRNDLKSPRYQYHHKKSSRSRNIFSISNDLTAF